MTTHDHFSGHLGVNKTTDRILRHFYWSGLKRDVVRYCRSCHSCQIIGKPYQVIPPAPLQPIPVASEPFEHVILECVGQLPQMKSGNQWLLTIMCSLTRFLRNPAPQNHGSYLYQGPIGVLFSVRSPENRADRPWDKLYVPCVY